MLPKMTSIQLARAEAWDVWMDARANVKDMLEEEMKCQEDWVRAMEREEKEEKIIKWVTKKKIRKIKERPKTNN